MKDGSTKKKVKTIDENLEDDEETKWKKVLENLQATFGEWVMVLDDKKSTLEEEIKKKAKDEYGDPLEDDDEILVLDEDVNFFQNFYELYWNTFYKGSNWFLYAVI